MIETKGSRSGTGRYILAYSAAFAVVALLAFLFLLIQGKTVIWEGDALKQHLKALSFMGTWIRSAFASLFAGDGFSLPTYSFSMGYGGDIVSTMSYYAIGDPLNLVSVFVPARYTYILFNVLAVLRMYLAGLAFSLYCRKMRLGDWNAILAGAISYAFCLFALCAVVRHPFFLNAMIYLPLVLLGVERVISKRKPAPFIAAIAVSALSNFYFFYMIFVLMALYIVMRLAYLNRRDIKASLRDFGWLFGCGLIGVLIAGVLFIPSALAVLSDARSGADAAVGILYGIEHYKAFLFGFTATSNPGEWTFCGYGMVALIAVFLLFSHKGNVQLKIAFGVLTAMLLLPAAGLAMNGFSYASNRWVWGYSMLISLILVVNWNRLGSLRPKQTVGLAVACLAYLALSAYCGSSVLGTKQALLICAFQALVAAAALAIGHLEGRRDSIADKAPEKKRAHRAGERMSRRADIGLYALIAISIAANSACLLAPFAAGYSDNLLTWDYASGVSESEAQIVSNYAEENSEGDSNNEFWRYSGTYWIVSPNAGLLANAPSTDYYWSLSNADISQFAEELGVNTQEYESNRYRNLDERTMLEGLARVNYHLALEDEPLPFGFSLSAEEESNDDRSWKIFENDLSLPFAYACGSQTARGDYDAEDAVWRQQALTQSVLVDEKIAGIDTAEVRDESKRVPFATDTSKAITANADGSFSATGAGCIYLAFDGEPDAETYLQITGLETDTPRSKLGLKVTFTYDDGTEVEKTLRYSTSGYRYSSGRTDFIVNSGYSEHAVTSIAIKLPVEGTYCMDLDVVCQDFENYDENIEQLSSNPCENLDMGYPDSGLTATNRVSFDIAAEKPSIVTTAIPFSSGWSVEVDGKPADLLRTNTMYAGFTIDAGEHSVVMEYRTPGLNAGIAASIFGLVAFAVLMTALHRRRKG